MRTKLLYQFAASMISSQQSWSSKQSKIKAENISNKLYISFVTACLDDRIISAVSILIGERDHYSRFQTKNPTWDIDKTNV